MLPRGSWQGPGWVGVGAQGTGAALPRMLLGLDCLGSSIKKTGAWGHPGDCGTKGFGMILWGLGDAGVRGLISWQ